MLDHVRAGAVTHIYAGGGDDIVYIGSNATRNGNSGGTLNRIDERVTIDTGGGNDHVVLDETAENAGATNTLFLSATDITGLGLTDDDLARGIGYVNVEDLTFNLGAAPTWQRARRSFGTVADDHTGAGACTRSTRQPGPNVNGDLKRGDGNRRQRGGLVNTLTSTRRRYRRQPVPHRHCDLRLAWARTSPTATARRDRIPRQ